MQNKRISNKFSLLNLFLDFAFIIVAAVGSLSIIRYVTYDVIRTPFDSFLGLLIYAIVLYLLRFGCSFKNSFLHSCRHKKLYSFLMFIYIWESVQSLINGVPGKAVSYIFLLIFSSIVSEYIYRLYKENNRIEYVIRPYIYYSLYNSFAILISGILLLVGVITRFDIPLELPIFEDNISKGYNFYFPGYLSVVGADSRLLSILGIPTFCGLSHEPHVLCYTLFPVVFLSNFFLRNSKFKNLFVFLQAFVLIFMVTSATAILCCVVVFMVHEIWSFFIYRKKSSILLVLVLIPLFVYFTQTELFYWLSSFLEDKTSGGETTDYSYNLLKYVISPTAIIGCGINPPISIADGLYKDIGLLSSFFILIFYIYFLVVISRNIVSKNLLSHYVGLACLYFALHSLKLSVLTFNYSYLIYMVTILCVVDSLRYSET